MCSIPEFDRVFASSHRIQFLKVTDNEDHLALLEILLGLWMFYGPVFTLWIFSVLPQESGFSCHVCIFPFQVFILEDMWSFYHYFVLSVSKSYNSCWLSGVVSPGELVMCFIAFVVYLDPFGVKERSFIRVFCSKSATLFPEKQFFFVGLQPLPLLPGPRFFRFSVRPPPPHKVLGSVNVIRLLVLHSQLFSEMAS